jgi:quercetin dioxygenase-like cupin family protein
MIETCHIDDATMATRVARFEALRPLPVQRGQDLSLAALDIVYARQLLSVIGLEPGAGQTPINAQAPIIGAGGMTMTLAICPPGQGPELHAHRQTFETFTVMQGRFEVRWNDQGENRLELGRFDTISVPPGVCRAFRNIGDEEGILQVIITGGVHDMNDIDFSKAVVPRIDAADAQARARFEALGFTFTAGAARAG